MRYIKVVVIPVLVGILLEVFVFNYAFWKFELDRNSPMMVLTLDNAALENWQSTEGGLVSLDDPQLNWPDLQCNVETISITYCADKSPETIIYYYSTDTGENVAGHFSSQLASSPEGEETISLKKKIVGLRLDFGETHGITLRSLSLTLNERSFDFSISRVCAVVIIAFSGVFLFSLQRMPDYQLDDQSEKSL